MEQKETTDQYQARSAKNNEKFFSRTKINPI